MKKFIPSLFTFIMALKNHFFFFKFLNTRFKISKLTEEYFVSCVYSFLHSMHFNIPLFCNQSRTLPSKTFTSLEILKCSVALQYIIAITPLVFPQLQYIFLILLSWENIFSVLVTRKKKKNIFIYLRYKITPFPF